jgi:hypothetical protein
VLDPRLAAVVAAAAEAVTFTATGPLLPEGVPAIVRAAVTMAIIPVLVQSTARSGMTSPSLVAGACAGVAYGLGASIVAGAVKGAGAAVDAALGSPPFVSVTKADGPVERLYHLAYGLVLFGSGGFAAMIATLGGPGAFVVHHGIALGQVTVLAATSFRECLLLAGPCLFAQALATIATGLVARASPGIGGILFGAQLSSACVVFALAVGATTLGGELLDLVRNTIAIAWDVMR